MYDRFIKPNTNCVDVGCHIGSVLAEFCKRAPQGNHYAFEAVPHKATFLQRKFPRAHVVQCAVSDHEGTVTFYEDKQRPGFSGLGRTKDGCEQNALTVPCRTLDRVIPSDHVIGLIKIDVEGAEELVLRGGFHTISQHRPVIIFESTPKGAEKLDLSTEGLFNLVHNNLKYEVYTPGAIISGHPPLSLSEFADAHRYPFAAFNFVGIPLQQSVGVSASQESCSEQDARE